MFTIHPQYIKDNTGKKMVVLLKKEFDSLMEMLEELEEIRIYDEAKKDNEPSLPIDEAFEEIEKKRKSK